MYRRRGSTKNRLVSESISSNPSRKGIRAKHLSPSQQHRQQLLIYSILSYCTYLNGKYNSKRTQPKTTAVTTRILTRNSKHSHILAHSPNQPWMFFLCRRFCYHHRYTNVRVQTYVHEIASSSTKQQPTVRQSQLYQAVTLLFVCYSTILLEMSCKNLDEKWKKQFYYMNTMCNSNSTNSLNSTSNSTNGTDSTHTQSDPVSPPPIQCSVTVENLANIRRWPAKTLTNKSVSHTQHTHKPFRKCQSFIHLSKISSERVHSALIKHESIAKNDQLLDKSSSSSSSLSPSAIYTTIKQEHRYFVYRIFSRCKVVMFR